MGLVARPAIVTASDTAVLHVGSDSVAGTIVATYTNLTKNPVYLGLCGRTWPDFKLDRDAAGRWVPGYEPVCMLSSDPPLEVRPGESRTDTLPLWDSRLPHAYHRFQSPEITGTYRIVYTAHDCCRTPPGGAVRHGTRLPKKGHVSEPFRIKVLE